MIKKKPVSYSTYDYTKGEIDILNQRMRSYATKYKTRKWALVALSYVLDMAHTNSQAMYVINNAKVHVDSFEFGWELMKALIKPNMHTRLARGDLSKHLQNSITHILGIENDKVEQPLQMMILQGDVKCALLHLMEKGINQPKIQSAK